MSMTIKKYKTPMIADDHPELDNTPLLNDKNISLYRMLIGCAMWAITLGTFDIHYATSTLSRFLQIPREGHLKRAIRIIGFLKA